LPETERTPARTRAELVRDADTAPVPDGPTLVDAERPRKSRKVRKPRAVPWWQQRRTAIAASVVGLFLIVAIAIAARGEKDPDPSSQGNSGAPDRTNAIGKSSLPNPFRPANPAKVRKALPLLYVVPSAGVYGPDYYPVLRDLDRGGVRVVTASGEGGTARLHGEGGSIAIDQRLDEVDAGDYAGIVFCGFRIDEYLPGGRHGTRVAALVNDMRRQGKPVTAICVGQGVLISHGFLEGKLAARSPALIDNYPEVARGANWIDKQVHTAQDSADSPPIVTAGMADDAEEFAAVLLKMLAPK
jgi:putative intracellular protease/amidase